MITSVGKRVYEPLNKQITDEMQVAYLYFAISSVLSDMGLNGCATWARSQFRDRVARSEQIHDHMLARGAKAKLMPVQAPKQDWRAPLHIFEEVARIEQRATTAFYGMLDLAISEKDYATNNFLASFVDKQVENETFSTYLLDRLRKMQSTELGVIMFDTELAKKVQHDIV
jgi:ferritin